MGCRDKIIVLIEMLRTYFKKNGKVNNKRKRRWIDIEWFSDKSFILQCTENVYLVNICVERMKIQGYTIGLLSILLKISFYFILKNKQICELFIPISRYFQYLSDKAKQSPLSSKIRCIIICKWGFYIFIFSFFLASGTNCFSSLWSFHKQIVYFYFKS